MKNRFFRNPFQSIKGKATEWDTIFANHTSSKEPKSVIYEEFSKLIAKNNNSSNSNKTKNMQLKMSKIYEQIFHQRGYTDGK